MNASDIATVFKLQSHLKQNSPNIIEQIEQKLWKSINSKNISNLNSIECGIIYLHKPREQTLSVSILCEDHLSKFKSDQFGNVQISDNSSFMHSELQNLIFPNLYSPQFEQIIKDVFTKYDKILLKPLQEKVFELNIYKQENFKDLKAIEKFKDQPKDLFETYEAFRMSKKQQMDQEESSILKILLQDLLFKHNLYHKTVEKKLNHLIEIEENYDNALNHFNIQPIASSKIKFDFLFAPVKGFERSYIKLKESFDSQNKYQLNSLKDLTRASIVFKNSKDLVNFQQKFKKNIEKSNEFKIQEVKNMFKNDTDYNYKDIKIILGFKANDTLTLIIEIQLILYDILVMKKTMHKFQDVMRADFTPHREELVNILSTKLETDSKLEKDVKWGPNNLMYPLYIQAIVTIHFLEEKFSTGTELSYEKVESNSEVGFMHLRQVEHNGHKYKSEQLEKPNQFEQQIQPQGTEDKEKTYVVGFNVDYNMNRIEGMISFQYLLMRTDSKDPVILQDRNGKVFKSNVLCLVFDVTEDQMQWHRLIAQQNDNTGIQLGNSYLLSEKLEIESQNQIIYNNETNKFEPLIYCDDNYYRVVDWNFVEIEGFDWSVYDEDYIPEYDIKVFIKKEIEPIIPDDNIVNSIIESEHKTDVIQTENDSEIKNEN